MKKQVLIFILSFVFLGGFSQTVTTLPSGAKPYGNQLYIVPSTGEIYGGNAGFYYRVFGTKRYIDSTANIQVKKVGDTMSGRLTLPSQTISRVGQAITTYQNTSYPVKSFVGQVGNPELNASYNMDYNKPGLEGVHLYTNSAYPAIWTAHGTGGFYIQMARANLTQTGFLRASVVGGSGYTNGIYNVASIENLTGTGTGANATVYINSGVVTSVIPGVGGSGYQVGDTFTVPAASLGGTGSGFVATISVIGNDIWVQDGLKYMLALNLNQQAGFGFSSGSTYGDARVVSRRLGTEANFAGYSGGLWLEGHRTTGIAGDIHLNALSTGASYLGEGGGNSYISDGGGDTFLGRNGGKGYFGTSTVENTSWLFNSTFNVPVLPGSPLGRAIYNRSTVNATQDNQELIGFDFTAALNDNGHSGIKKTEARFNNKIQNATLSINQAVFSDANKNLVSNAVVGTGSVVMSTSPSIANITGTGTFALTGGSVALNNATSNWLAYIGAGLGAPAFTTRSTGTKAIWFPAITAAAADYATGIESNFLWSSVPTTAAGFKWYGGTTLAATITGTGNLTLVGKATIAGAPTTATDAVRLSDMSIVNTTTTALSTTDLNTAYPTVILGFRVICPNISGAPVIYTKATESGSSDVWLTTSAVITP